MRSFAAHWGNSYCSPVSCDKRMTEHGCAMRSLTAHWGSFYCSPFSCDKRLTEHCCAMKSLTAHWSGSYCSFPSCDKSMSNLSGDFVTVCLSLCLLAFVGQVYKI